MLELTRNYIQNNIADSWRIYKRGMTLFHNGAFYCNEFEVHSGTFSYEVDGNYGDYTISIELGKDDLYGSCDCPYPGNGCKHIVAVLLDIQEQLKQQEASEEAIDISPVPQQEAYLSEKEIKDQAIEDRYHRAKLEPMKLVRGEMIKGTHVVISQKEKEYFVTLHQPKAGNGHCSCPDFHTNRLNTCKHIIFAVKELQEMEEYEKQLTRERFPFIDVYWDSVTNKPKLFHEKEDREIADIADVIEAYFNIDGTYRASSLKDFSGFLTKLYSDKRVRIQENVIDKLNDFYLDEHATDLMSAEIVPSDNLKTKLYPYQEQGVLFGVTKKAVLIGDEMGLGKTVQAIALAIQKQAMFEFGKVLIITLASLKDQWKREVEKFTNRKAAIVAGNPMQRAEIYRDNSDLFKITNYEATLRDINIITEYNPDFVILDEAQRIKNFETKTADIVKRIPRKHALVLTGTPLENKLEDVYSIVQFLDPSLLAPLWQFAADHFLIDRNKKGKILGYRNLNLLQEKLKPLIIRRKKEDVLPDLPEEVTNNYFVTLTAKQYEIHQSLAQSLMPILNKKRLTPIDMQRIQELLLKMRQVCDSTYLIDRKTNQSPKLSELKSILEELVVQNRRKVVIFSEWTTMTYLIGSYLSGVGIPFVELSGKIPVKKRQLLIDEFTQNPDCKVFLSTDAGGTGLNLQVADCVINFEIPWNPAKLNQRIGRVSRIGQTSTCINVINLIAKNGIEEKILAGVQLKLDLFKGVFEGGADQVTLSREKKNEMLMRLQDVFEEKSTLPSSHPVDEIPEDLPHYLNPEVLHERDERFDYKEKEAEEAQSEGISDQSEVPQHRKYENKSVFSGQPEEKVESVLNNGLQFIGGLIEMATGQKLEAVQAEEKMVHIDSGTGEITMKFKLPGF